MMCALQVAMILHRNIHVHANIYMYVCMYVNEHITTHVCKFRMLSAHGENYHMSCDYTYAYVYTLL